MTIAEIWRDRTDEEITDAVSRLAGYSEEVRSVIIAEATYRGLDTLPTEASTPNRPAARWRKRSLRTRRAIAFLIDGSIVVALWAIVDNMIMVPVSAVLVTLGPALFFCAYFGVTEGTQATRASLGKRVAGLEVVRRDGTLPSLMDILLRSAILAAALKVDWGAMISSVVEPATMPVVAWPFVWCVPAALVLCNLLLALRSDKAILIQDGLLFTKVTPREKHYTREIDALEHPSRLEWPKPIFCTVIFALTYAVALVVTSVYGLRQADLIVSDEIEEFIYRECQTRSRVSVSETTRWSLGSEPVRSLSVSVWVPYLAWDVETHGSLLDCALENLRVEPGYYESGSIRLWSGFESNFLSLAFQQSYDLNLP